MALEITPRNKRLRKGEDFSSGSQANSIQLKDTYSMDLYELKFTSG